MNEFELIKNQIWSETRGDYLVKCHVNDRDNIIRTAIRNPVGITAWSVSDNLILTCILKVEQL